MAQRKTVHRTSKKQKEKIKKALLGVLVSLVALVLVVLGVDPEWLGAIPGGNDLLTLSLIHILKTCLDPGEMVRLTLGCTVFPLRMRATLSMS